MAAPLHNPGKAAEVVAMRGGIRVAFGKRIFGERGTTKARTMASIMCESTDSRQSDLDAMRPRRESSSPIGEDGIAAAPGGQDAENAAVIAFRGQQVFCGSQAIALSATEYRLLELLASRPGEVLSRRQILDELHGAQYAITERAIDTQLVGVRRKLGQWAHCIETVRGRGYRFRPLELPATFADDSDAGASPLE